MTRIERDNTTEHPTVKFIEEECGCSVSITKGSYHQNALIIYTETKRGHSSQPFDRKTTFKFIREIKKLLKEQAKG